jgi:hypothetical protein
MSTAQTSTLWRVTGSDWMDDEPDVSTIVLSLRANNADYAVACTGPKGMKSDQFISALRAAAAAALIGASGGDLSTVGAAQLGLFDTGDQRAN